MPATIINAKVGAGKQYATPEDLMNWATTQNLKGNNLMVDAETFGNPVFPSGFAVNDTTRECCVVFRPTDAENVNKLNASGSLGYGPLGAVLNLSGKKNYGGVSFADYRYDATGGGMSVVESNYFDGRPSPQFIRCRVRVGDGTSLGYGEAEFIDTIVELGQGSEGPAGFHSANQRLTRVIFYLASGATSATGISSPTYAAADLVDCVFGPGVKPYKRNGSGPIRGSNNFAAMAGDGAADANVLTITAAQLFQGAGDVRPAAGAPTIGAASNSAKFTYDIRGNYRGELPDIGASQLNAQSAPQLPDLTVTNIKSDEQILEISGTFAGSLLSGVASIQPASTGAGNAEAKGPIDISINTAASTWKAAFGVAKDGGYANPAPTIIGTNAGGNAAAKGGAPFTVAAVVKPVGAITSHQTSYRKLKGGGTTSNKPTSGVLRLTGSAPDGTALNVADKPITLGDGTFTFDSDTLPFGTYQAEKILLSNLAGITEVTAGGQAFNVVAPQKPVVTIQNVRIFDFRGILIEGKIEAPDGAPVTVGTFRAVPSAGNAAAAVDGVLRIWGNLKRFEAFIPGPLGLGDWVAQIRVSNDGGPSDLALGPTGFTIAAKAAKAGALTTATFKSTASAAQAVVMQTFGQSFKMGELAAGKKLSAMDNLGNNVPIQIDQIASHVDGSVQFGVLSAQVANLAAGELRTVTLSSSSSQAADAGYNTNLIDGLVFDFVLTNKQIYKIDFKKNGGGSWLDNMAGGTTVNIQCGSDALTYTHEAGKSTLDASYGIANLIGGTTRYNVTRPGGYNDPDLYVEPIGSGNPAFGLTISASGGTPGVTIPRAVNYIPRESSTAYRATPNLATATKRLKGPVCTELEIYTPLVRVSDNAEHQMLFVKTWIRIYNGGASVRVDASVENNFTYTPGRISYTYDMTAKIGSTVYLSETALRQWPRSRWHKKFWIGTAPQVDFRQNLGYIFDSKVIWNYDRSIIIPEADLASMGTAAANFQAAKPLTQNLGVRTAFADTGGADQIGFQPNWTAKYLISQDPRALAWMLANADAAASCPVHFRDKATGNPVRITDYPRTELGNFFGKAGGDAAYPEFDAGNPFSIDTSHQGDFAYAPYLITGDAFYLEETQFWASRNLGAMDPDYRNSGLGKLIDQVRGKGWGFRSLVQAYALAPDGHAMKTFFRERTDYNLDQFVEDWSSKWSNQDDVMTPLASLDGKTVPTGTSGPRPWQNDFVFGALQLAIDLNNPKALDFYSWCARHAIGRYLAEDEGFCRAWGSMYNCWFFAGDTGGDGKWFRTWGDVGRYRFPSANSCPINEPMYEEYAGGYTAISWAVFAMASGTIMGAETCYAWLTARSPQVKESMSGFANYGMAPRVAAAPATDVTLSSPSSATVGVGFKVTIGANGPIAADTLVTIAVTNATVSPAQVKLMANAPTLDATVTPNGNGDVVITLTNDKGLANPVARTVTASALPGPTLALTTATANNGTLSASGTVDTRGASDAALVAYVDPQDGSPSTGPEAVTITGGTFSYSKAGAPRSYKLRFVATANGKTTTVTSDVLTIEASAPTVTATASASGLMVGASGTVNLQGDSAGTLRISLRPISGGGSLGPYTPTINGSGWSLPAKTVTQAGQWVAEAVATANSKIATAVSAAVTASNPARFVRLSLVDETSNPISASDLSGLRWALFAQSLPDQYDAPIAKGVGVSSIDGNKMVLSISAGAGSIPAVAGLILSKTDGTVIYDTISFAAPVEVS